MVGKQGSIVMISGPSGVGKGTVIADLLRRPELRLRYSISATTRAKRSNEVEGQHYFFKTREEFQKMIERNELLEYAEYVNNYYGTPLSYVNAVLGAGDNLLLEIEYQGAIQVLRKGLRVVSVFLAPPSFEELYSRLKTRGSETIEFIDQRIEQAKTEIEAAKGIYEHIVVNDVLERTIDEVYAILAKELNE